MRRTGRNRPVETVDTHPHLFRGTAHYRLALPPAPPVIDYWTGCAGLSDILGNDKLGDCTAAGACHAVVAIEHWAGSRATFLDVDAIAFYSQSTGYDGTPATDQGGDEIAVMTSWRDKGLRGHFGGVHKIAGWLTVDPSDTALIRSLLATFGPCLGFCVELPDEYLNVEAGGTWGVGTPNPANGHYFVGVGATDAGVQVDTWGLVDPAPVTITYEAIAALCTPSAGGALYAVLSPDVIERATKKAPDGCDWTALATDFDAIGGNVPREGPSLLSRIEAVLRGLVT